MSATSGLRAGTRSSFSPVKGQSISFGPSTRPVRSEPIMLRTGMNGTPIAPAR